MRVVLLLPKLHAGAELALNKLLEQQKEVNIVGVVRSDISPFRWKYWKYVQYGVRRSGMFYGGLIALLFYLHVFGVFLAGLLWWRRKRRWLTLDELIQRYDLFYHDTEDINSPQTLEVIRSWEPDVVVSLYFDQILKKEALQLAKQASINMHPGLLPQYKGLWPSFWKLYNQEKQAGVTIHRMTEKIDEGAVIAQKKYRISGTDTKFSLLLKSGHHGAQLLLQTLKKMKQKLPLPPLELKGKPAYYSLPNRRHFARFFAQKNKLFSWLAFSKAFERFF